MPRKIIELGSLKSGCRATVVIEYDVLLLQFSFSEMTMALLIGDALDLLGMFLHNQVLGVKTPMLSSQIGQTNFQVSLIMENNA